MGMKNLIKVIVVCSSLLLSVTAFAGANPSDCAECDGKIDNMILQYTGGITVFVEVFSHKGVTLFANTVKPNKQFVLSGDVNFRDNKNTLGPFIKFVVDGVEVGILHTSCSVEIGPGTTLGDFVVLAATSRNGGLTCPVDMNTMSINVSTASKGKGKK